MRDVVGASRQDGQHDPVGLNVLRAVVGELNAPGHHRRSSERSPSGWSATTTRPSCIESRQNAMHSYRYFSSSVWTRLGSQGTRPRSHITTIDQTPRSIASSSMALRAGLTRLHHHLPCREAPFALREGVARIPLELDIRWYAKALTQLAESGRVVAERFLGHDKLRRRPPAPDALPRQVIRPRPVSSRKRIAVVSRSPVARRIMLVSPQLTKRPHDSGLSMRCKGCETPPSSSLRDRARGGLLWGCVAAV